MGFAGLLKLLSEKFAEMHIRYALIGGLALHVAGYRRSTGDVDLLVHAEDIDKLKAILFPLGYTVIHESEDVLNWASPWQLVGGIDVIKARRHYALNMLARAKECKTLDDISLRSAVPEDIIGLKVQAVANDPDRTARDMADVEWLICHGKGALDMVLVREYFGVFSMEAQLEAILEKVSYVE